MSVTNAASASLTGGYDGISVIGGAGTVVNYGGIAGGSTGNGIYLNAGGSVTNAASASITSGLEGIGISNGAGTVVNDGSIAAIGIQRSGGYLTAGGSATNAAYGSGLGAYRAVVLHQSAGFWANSGESGGRPRARATRSPAERGATPCNPAPRPPPAERGSPRGPGRA